MHARIYVYVFVGFLFARLTDTFRFVCLLLLLFFEALGARIRNGEYREMLFCLPILRELQVFMEGGSFCNPYDIAVFLKNCPCLEALFIDVSTVQSIFSVENN